MSLGRNNSFLAEIMAIIHAVLQAYNHFWNHIWLESESMAAISKPYIINSTKILAYLNFHLSKYITCI